MSITNPKIKRRRRDRLKHDPIWEIPIELL